MRKRLVNPDKPTDMLQFYETLRNPRESLEVIRGSQETMKKTNRKLEMNKNVLDRTYTNAK